VSPRPQKGAHAAGLPQTSRTSPCGAADATSRLRTAQAYLDVAELVLGERDRDEYLNVAAGVAVIAGIAASDAICCARLGRHPRGDNHRSAADILRQVTVRCSEAEPSSFQRCSGSPTMNVHRSENV
jgi:hypothetical protein